MGVGLERGCVRTAWAGKRIIPWEISHLQSPLWSSTQIQPTNGDYAEMVLLSFIWALMTVAEGLIWNMVHFHGGSPQLL